MPRNRIFTVWPLKLRTLKVCCWYPAALFRLEKVPNVANTVLALLRTCTWNVSNAVVVVVSAVSMCNQKTRLALVAVDGMVTVCTEESVCVVP